MTPETVTPAGLFTEAWAATERHRTDDTHPLEAPIGRDHLGRRPPQRFERFGYRPRP
jgi:hypothetical protein